jgi:hypothetical protein
MPAGSPKYLEVISHLASADAAIEVGASLDATDRQREEARLKAQEGIAAASAIAMLDLADAIRGATHAATVTVPGIQDMRAQRTGG